MIGAALEVALGLVVGLVVTATVLARGIVEQRSRRRRVTKAYSAMYHGAFDTSEMNINCRCSMLVKGMAPMPPPRPKDTKSAKQPSGGYRPHGTEKILPRQPPQGGGVTAASLAAKEYKIKIHPTLTQGCRECPSLESCKLVLLGFSTGTMAQALQLARDRRKCGKWPS